jgi:hypothetical protein
MDEPKFYECGICGAYHPAEWIGDCREDAVARFNMDELDDEYGVFGWDEVPRPA